ncbi:uncharacterized protein LOC34623825 [Cyclospora cayetanensis]|uniref:Uncharacterized protein LOC34623825 n=1 Tax=Cyclospora cayetanensis TaxID=88456 RepID=A0A6P6S306_9EIME|nr:uncharacterized protein LOC34623825 [Cyclospora cayetanensis]
MAAAACPVACITHGLEKQLAFLDAAAAAGAASTGAPTDAEGLIAALHAEGEVVLSQEPQHIAPPPAADPQLQHGPPQLQPIQQQMRPHAWQQQQHAVQLQPMQHAWQQSPQQEAPQQELHYPVTAVSTPDVKEAPVAAPVGPSLSAVASQSSASVAGGDAAVAVWEKGAPREGEALEARRWKAMETDARKETAGRDGRPLQLPFRLLLKHAD